MSSAIAVYREKETSRRIKKDLPYFKFPESRFGDGGVQVGEWVLKNKWSGNANEFKYRPEV